MVASGRLQAKPFAEERFNKTGVGAEPNEFDLWVNTGMYRDPMQLANHETLLTITEKVQNRKLI